MSVRSSANLSPTSQHAPRATARHTDTGEAKIWNICVQLHSTSTTSGISRAVSNLTGLSVSRSSNETLPPGCSLSSLAMAASATTEQQDPELQAAAWDLEPLVDGEGQEGVEPRMAQALERSHPFSERHAGKLAAHDAEAHARAGNAPCDRHLTPPDPPDDSLRVRHHRAHCLDPRPRDTGRGLAGGTARCFGGARGGVGNQSGSYEALDAAAYAPHTMRTTIDIDRELVERVMQRYGEPTKRAAVDLALRRLDLEPMTREEALAMRGSGWDGDLDAMRRSWTSNASTAA
jgi:Arc/MetJ family transcription regulator